MTYKTYKTRPEPPIWDEGFPPRHEAAFDCRFVDRLNPESPVFVKVLIAIAVALGAMVAVVAALGARLPVGHTATRAAIIGAPSDVVFTTITDFANAPSWRSDVRKMTESVDASSGRKRVTEESSNGTMMMEIEQLVPNTRLVTRIVGDDLPWGGAWAYALEPQGNTTRVTITEHGEVYNPIFRFISSYIMGHTATMDTYLTNLGRKFGGEVTIIDAPTVPVK
jgi:hypothetical protein